MSTTQTDVRIPRRRGLLARLAAVLCLAGLVSAPAAAADFGFEPGSVLAKFHAPVDQPAPPYLFPRQGVVFDTDAWLQPIKDAPEVTQAGSHPDFTTSFAFNRDPDFPLVRTDGNVRDVVVDTPPGFIGNPRVVPTCTTTDFYRLDFSACPAASQVGEALVFSMGSGVSTHSPVFSLVPPPGVPAMFGFKSFSISAVMTPAVRSDGDYGLRVSVKDAMAAVGIVSSAVTLWGDPYDPVHDPHRIDASGFLGGSMPANREPFLTLPTSCDSGPLQTSFRARSWQEPDRWVEESVAMSEPTGCEKLAFGEPGAEVRLTAQPTSRQADSPTGLDVNLDVPYQDDAKLLGYPTLRDAVVTLPEGMAINPSAANGLAACSPQQIGLKSLDQPACPAASEVGAVEIDTPLLAEPMKGSVYQAAQGDNPFGSTFAVYVAAQGPGVQIKLAGKVEADPVTGRLTTTFEDNPQLPFENFNLKFFGGPRAALVNPPTCGTKTTSGTLTPWSAPHSGGSVEVQDSFQIDSVPGGGPCVTDIAARPFGPTMSAGMGSAVGGAFSPFTFQLTRPDGHQEILSTEVRPPQGVMAKLAGVARCADTAASQGLCPESARIGSTVVGAGAGTSPFYVEGADAGQVYLTGPYDPDGPGAKPQAPLGMAIEVPAKAGPFNLGTVNVRAAIYVDPATAKLRVVSDPLPQILEGVPLRVRDIRVNVDRAKFALAPSDCTPTRIDASVISVHGARAELTDRFQVGDCAALAFRPRLAMRLTGRKQTRSGRHPGVRAVVRQRGIGEAGIANAKVVLPKSLALDPDNAQALCEFTDGTKPDLENHCPKGSIVGRAKATTPLLDKPLTGNLYFVKNVRRDPRTGNQIRTLPMIIAALRGEIDINLRGTSSTNKNGQLVNTFAGVPDAPISRFDINVNGGKNGILVITQTRKGKINVCTSKQTASTAWQGQNGARRNYKVTVKRPCATSKPKGKLRLERQRRKAAARRS